MLIRDWSGRDRPPLERSETLHRARMAIGRKAAVCPYAVIDFCDLLVSYKVHMYQYLHETHTGIAPYRDYGAISTRTYIEWGVAESSPKMICRLMRHDG